MKRNIKSICAVLLAFMMFLGVCGIDDTYAAGEEDITYGVIHSDLYKVQQNNASDEEEIYEAMIENQSRYMMASGKSYSQTQIDAVSAMIESGSNEYVDLSKYNIKVSDFQEILEIAKRKSALAMAAYGSSTIQYAYNSTYVLKAYVNSYYSYNQFISRYNQIKSAFNKILNSIPSFLSDEEKVLFVHDYLVYNCEYDYENYLAGTLSADSYDMYGTLINKNCVCAGYSLTFRAVMDSLGIECEYIVSDEMNHAWNLVKLHGEWFHIDLTFDDPVFVKPIYDKLGYCGHNYFLKNDSEMLANGHSGWNSNNIVCNSKRYSNIAAGKSDSKTVYNNNNWYYTYNSNIYKGSPFSTTTGQKIDVGTGVTLLGIYKNTFVYVYDGKLYSSDIAGKSVKNLSQELGITGSVNQLHVNDNGSVKYALLGSNKLYTFNLGNNVPVTGVKLNKTSVTLNTGQTVTLIPTILPSDSTDKSVSWSSGNTKVATVSQNGVVTAKGEGTTTITVKTTDGNKTATCKVVVEGPKVSYTTHVQNIGWQNYVSNGAMAGTSGKALRLEGIKIKLDSTSISGGISYRTHVQTYGWQSFVSNNTMSGTSGESKRLEAIQIKLTGNIANYYDVYYRVHAQTYGWLGWAKNGESAGTAGYGKRLEGIEIRLVKKGGQAPGSIANCYYDKSTIPSVSYTTHVQNVGWQNYVSDGAMAGTAGQSLRLEAIKIKVDSKSISGGISYKTHVQTYGWQSFVSNNSVSGTSGQSKRLEAIQIKLTGELANKYDVYYRVHAETYGWLGWAKNGASAGTSGLSKRLEGIEIVLVKKGEKAPGSTSRAYVYK